jgi:hypothetical protein
MIVCDLSLEFGVCCKLQLVKLTLYPLLSQNVPNESYGLGFRV